MANLQKLVEAALPPTLDTAWPGPRLPPAIIPPMQPSKIVSATSPGPCCITAGHGKPFCSHRPAATAEFGFTTPADPAVWPTARHDRRANPTAHSFPTAIHRGRPTTLHNNRTSSPCNNINNPLPNRTSSIVLLAAAAEDEDMAGEADADVVEAEAEGEVDILADKDMDTVVVAAATNNPARSPRTSRQKSTRDGGEPFQHGVHQPETRTQSPCHSVQCQCRGRQR